VDSNLIVSELRSVVSDQKQVHRLQVVPQRNDPFI